jgi:hypothetical protein
MSALGLTVLLALSSSAPYVRSHATQDASSHCLWWGETAITWVQSSVGNPATGASVFDAVTNGFLTWQDTMSHCGNTTFTEGPRTSARKIGVAASGPNANVVLFRYSTCSKKVAATNGCWAAGTCANDYDCWDHPTALLAITTVSYGTATGRIVDADVEFDAADNTFTTVNQPVCSTKLAQTCIASDVQNTMTHEIGHFLGLAHTDALHSTMNATASIGETSKRVIDPGTTSFVCEVYARGLATSDCVVDPISDTLGAPASAAGCSSSGAGALGWAALALLGLAFKRRAALPLVLLVAASAQATTMLALDLDGLTASSEVVAQAKVRSVRSRWSADHARILTDVELEVVEAWKGAPARVVIATQPGGEVGGLGQHVEGLAQFTAGEEVVVFLEARGDRFAVTGAQQGKFRLERAGDGSLSASQGSTDALYLDAFTRQPVEHAPIRASLAALKAHVLGAASQSLPSFSGSSQR